MGHVIFLPFRNYHYLGKQPSTCLLREASQGMSRFACGGCPWVLLVFIELDQLTRERSSLVQLE